MKSAYVKRASIATRMTCAHLLRLGQLYGLVASFVPSQSTTLASSSLLASGEPDTLSELVSAFDILQVGLDTASATMKKCRCELLSDRNTRLCDFCHEHCSRNVRGKRSSVGVQRSWATKAFKRAISKQKKKSVRDGDSTLSTQESGGGSGSGIDFNKPISESLPKPGTKAKASESMLTINSGSS
jgi:hypothetical protein